MATNYKLIYFNIHGRAEVARMLFSLAGVPFEDKRVSSEWATLKPTTQFGSLPLLEVDGVQLGQSNAIGRYLARKFGFAGKTPVEEAQADAYVDHLNDCIEALILVAFESDKTKKECLLAGVVSKVPKFFKCFEERLKDHSYLVGSSLTWADIHLMVWIDSYFFVGILPKGTLDKYPAIMAHSKCVKEVPAIKAWMKKRPVSDK